MKRILLYLAQALLALAAAAQQPHVYINPGHGGHGSDDRNVVLPPFAAGDTAGFWESNSNLWKGFALQEILRKKGYRTSISRLKNEEANDLNLSTIVALCNASGADVFYAIHSNASGYGDSHPYNYPMGIYRGYTGQPQVAGSDRLTATLGESLITNQSTVWTNGGNYIIYGDWTFYPDWGLQGLGVLRGNRVPSMLSEGSFHDYYPEAYRLLNHDYDWVEGWNFSTGADRYFGRLDNYDKGIITGCLRDNRVLRQAAFQVIGDDRRLPIDRATVRLLDDRGNELDVTHTDTLQNGIYLFKYLDPGQYTIEASSPEHEPMVKQVTVEANRPTYCNFDLKKIRNTPPAVIDYTPQWAAGDEPLLCNVPVVLQFNWDMDTESVERAFSITPHVDGAIRWEDSNCRLVFTPLDAYDTSTLYTVTLTTEAMHGGGKHMTDDFTITFATCERNHLEQLAMFPTAGARVHMTKPVIEFRTDSIMDTYDLTKRFHVLDPQGNEMSYLVRSLKLNKKSDPYGFIRLPLARDLVSGDDYRLVVDREVADYDGVHLTDTIRLSFTAVDAATQWPAANVVRQLDSADHLLAGGPATATVTTATTSLLGDGAAQVAYTFAAADDWLRLDLARPLATTFAGGDTLAVLVWGDMSFNTLEAVLADEAGTEHLLPLATIDHHGWRWVEATVDAPGGPHRLDALRLARPADERIAQQGAAGTLRVDAIARMAAAGGSGLQPVVMRSVTVGPVPASDYLVASAETLIMAVELIDADGRTLARATGNCINVSAVPAGVYLMRVYLPAAVSTHKVVVTH